MWRAQMNAFAADGWRCVAPDLRGYGGSSAPAADDAYTIEEVVADMAELHDHLGGKPAIWIGHDWGSVVAGALAAHEPKRSRGVVLTSLAYSPTQTPCQGWFRWSTGRFIRPTSIRMASGTTTLLHGALQGGGRRPRCRPGSISGIDFSTRQPRRSRQGFAERVGYA
jgi:pimeloyl-ACP methyl ester carboxylesterase